MPFFEEDLFCCLEFGGVLLTPLKHPSFGGGLSWKQLPEAPPQIARKGHGPKGCSLRVERSRGSPHLTASLEGTPGLDFRGYRSPKQALSQGYL